MERVVHVAIADDWSAACRLGEYEVSTRGVSLDEAGFIHAVSIDGVADVVGRVFADIRFALLLVVLDVEALRADGVAVTPAGGGYRIDGAIDTHGAVVIAQIVVDTVDGAIVLPTLEAYRGDTAST